MVAVTLETQAHSPRSAPGQLPVDTDAGIEIFEIPNARRVHGNAFPLGIRTKEGALFENLDFAIDYIESLTDRGIFHSLLSNRKPRINSKFHTSLNKAA